MRFSYELTVRDFISYSLYFNYKQIKKKYKILAVILAACFSLLIYVFFQYKMLFIAIILIPAISAYVYVLFFLTKLQVKSYVKRNFTKENSKCLFTFHAVEVDENGFKDQTTFGNSFTKWQGVTKIVKIKTHLFVFLSHNSAFIIPKTELISSDQFDEIIKIALKINPEILIVKLNKQFN